jgi:hypothetical protein
MYYHWLGSYLLGGGWHGHKPQRRLAARFCSRPDEEAFFSIAPLDEGLLLLFGDKMSRLGKNASIGPCGQEIARQQARKEAQAEAPHPKVVHGDNLQAIFSEPE